MRALEKDFLREVQHSKSRFLSIFILAALAVAFLSGLRATAPDMKQTIDSYMDEAHFMDVQVLSTLGVFLIDAFASAGKADAEGSDAVVKVYSLPEELNRLTVLEGRLPEAEDECVADKLMLTKMDAAVGDTVKLRTQGTYADSLARSMEHFLLHPQDFGLMLQQFVVFSQSQSIPGPQLAQSGVQKPSSGRRAFPDQV